MPIPAEVFSPEFITYIILTEVVILNYMAEELYLMFLMQILALNVDPTLTIFKNVYG